MLGHIPLLFPMITAGAMQSERLAAAIMCVLMWAGVWSGRLQLQAPYTRLVLCVLLRGTFVTHPQHTLCLSNNTSCTSLLLSIQPTILHQHPGAQPPSTCITHAHLPLAVWHDPQTCKRHCKPS